MNISGFRFGERQSICEAYMKVVREAEEEGAETGQHNDTSASDGVLKKMEDQGTVDTEDNEKKKEETEVEKTEPEVKNDDTATVTSTDADNTVNSTDTSVTDDSAKNGAVNDNEADKVDADVSNDYRRVKDTVTSAAPKADGSIGKPASYAATDDEDETDTVDSDDNSNDDGNDGSGNAEVDDDIADEVNSSELVDAAKENPEPYLSAEGIESMKNGEIDMDEIKAHPERFLSPAGMKLVMDVIRSRGGKNRQTA